MSDSIPGITRKELCYIGSGLGVLGSAPKVMVEMALIVQGMAWYQTR